MKISILSVFFLLTSISLFSQQKQQYLSANVSGLLSDGSRFSPAFGIAYEEKFATHHGYELGLNYRSKTRDIYVITNNILDYTVRESYLSLPISYKFYSNIVNFTTGISFDAFLGGKYLNQHSNVVMSSYDINPKLYVGWNFKVGKDFDLNDKFRLEPEILFNPIFNYNYSFYGISVKLKYKL